ncbi:MAG: hypothetical protein mread185_000489 [Mycoplasmataceae bacterium]|nr:MAG: hypothetical protein mread185_000489 [Mycoplasmataceae bacterium]
MTKIEWLIEEDLLEKVENIIDKIREKKKSLMKKISDKVGENRFNIISKIIVASKKNLAELEQKVEEVWKPSNEDLINLVDLRSALIYAEEAVNKPDSTADDLEEEISNLKKWKIHSNFKFEDCSEISEEWLHNFSWRVYNAETNNKATEIFDKLISLKKLLEIIERQPEQDLEIIKNNLQDIQDLIPNNNDLNQSISINYGELGSSQIAAYDKLKIRVDNFELELLKAQFIFSELNISQEEKEVVKKSSSKQELKEIQDSIQKKNTKWNDFFVKYNIVEQEIKDRWTGNFKSVSEVQQVCDNGWINPDHFEIDDNGQFRGTGIWNHLNPLKDKFQEYPDLTSNGSETYDPSVEDGDRSIEVQQSTPYPGQESSSQVNQDEGETNPENDLLTEWSDWTNCTKCGKISFEELLEEDKLCEDCARDLCYWCKKCEKTFPLNAKRYEKLSYQGADQGAFCSLMRHERKCELEEINLDDCNIFEEASSPQTNPQIILNSDKIPPNPQVPKQQPTPPPSPKQNPKEEKTAEEKKYGKDYSTLKPDQQVGRKTICENWKKDSNYNRSQVCCYCSLEFHWDKSLDFLLAQEKIITELKNHEDSCFCKNDEAKQSKIKENNWENCKKTSDRYFYSCRSCWGKIELDKNISNWNDAEKQAIADVVYHKEHECGKEQSTKKIAIYFSPNQGGNEHADLIYAERIDKSELRLEKDNQSQVQQLQNTSENNYKTWLIGIGIGLVVILTASLLLASFGKEEKSKK